MQVIPIKTSIVTPNEPIIPLITAHIPSLEEQTVLVITSKVVALAEGRHRQIASKEEKIALMYEESDIVVRIPWTWLTVKDGQVYKSAGIDESNVGPGLCVLLPEDAYASAQRIRIALCEHYNVRELGIIITDSRIPMQRQGAVGISLGYAGIEGIKDYRNTPDLFGRAFTSSRANVVDSLSAAAVLVMGEGNESYPIASITGAPITFTDREIKKEELLIPLHEDYYLAYAQELLSRQ
jgi:coenzyme F420-0:L-glutamate ligase